MRRHILRLLLLLPVLAIIECNPPGPARYQCGEHLPWMQGNAPCYGVVSFPSQGLAGFGTFVDLQPLFGGTAQGGYVSNSIRIVDSQNGSCQGGACWIEVGYRALAVNQSLTETTNFYWQENRPEGFFDYDLGVVPPSLFGPQRGGLLSGQQKALLLLFRNTSTNMWDGSIFPVAAPGAPQPRFTSNNPFTPRSAEMGQELTGVIGGSAPAVTFNFTGINPPAGPEGILTTITSDGTVRSDNPPQALWLTPPSASNGGIFRTTCCN